MTVAISTGPETHLDHLAPLCSLLEVPLIVVDEKHLDIGKKFYPMVEIEYVPLGTLTLDYIAGHFKTILTCGKYWAMELKPLLEMFYKKEVQFLFSPHGNSDKEKILNMPISQDIDLAYGPQMMRQKRGQAIELGNIRHWFYNKYKGHFDRLAAPFFQTEKKTVLYAPTWESGATSSSFFDHTDEVIALLSDAYNLLIKLHPLLEENNPALFHRLMGKYEMQAEFILEFPAIYPLLEKTDIYLGDFSSIGYDFLAFNRPLFFLKSGGDLQKCGKAFSGSIEDAQEELSTVREKMYADAFGEGFDGQRIKALLSEKVGL